MHKKNHKPKRVHSDTKENMVQNGHNNTHPEPKRKSIKKPQHFMHPLQQNHRHKNPQQLRHLCEQQEKLILAQYRSNHFFSHNQFYQYVRGQLANSKICTKIMMIKEMSNEEAQEQLLRLQELRAKYGEIPDLDEFKGGEEQEQVRVVFKQGAKKVSMIEENDDAYLEELGGGANCYSIQPEGDHLMEEELERQKNEPEPVTYSKYNEHQYYQNDDVFEF